MQPAVPRVRLYLDQTLASGGAVVLNRDRTHYLRDVIRLGPGDAVSAFNGRDGEWLCRIETAEKRSIALRTERRLAPQPDGVDLWLLFAPLKRGPGDTLVVKAVELGASALVPVMTARTVSKRVRQARMRSLAVEAAEQCGRCDVPETREPMPLSEVLDDWPAGRRLMFCDESGDSPPVADVLAGMRNGESEGPWAVLIGPEGGFTREERALLRARPFVHPVDLGPRLLRAETAAIAALACWQAVIGDWRRPGAAARAAAGRVRG